MSLHDDFWDRVFMDSKKMARAREFLPKQPATALDTQQGGDHYKNLKIQPVAYIDANGLDYFQGNVIKYITRHKAKNGAEDIRKAIHYCELILQLQYGEGKQ